MEQWKKIDKYNGDYEISNKGKLKTSGGYIWKYKNGGGK